MKLTRRLIPFLLSVVAWVATARSAEWKLVWADEFNGKSLDHSKWGVEVNAFGGGNNEMQIYSDRPENVRVQNGQLIIEARKDGYAESGIKREYS